MKTWLLPLPTCQSVNITQLSRSKSEWKFDAKEKADLFASTFTSKFGLPDFVVEPDIGLASCSTSEFVMVRTRWVKKELKRIQSDKVRSGQGSLAPDGA